jgi:colanic acid/amylovoran biosynthesis protein
MTFMLFGAGFGNKGAQLMLLTASTWIQDNFPDSTICMSAAKASASDAAEYNIELLKEFVLHTGADERTFRLSWSMPGLYRFARKLKGHKMAATSSTSWKDVDVVIDLSGLAYSEKWGKNPVVNLKWLTGKAKKDGKLYILMPQAFGPFTDEALRGTMAEAVNNVSMTFARDSESYSTLLALPGVVKEKVFQSPDLTHFLNVEPAPVYLAGRTKEYFVIVPNARMLDKAGADWKEKYVGIVEKMAMRTLEATDLDLLLMTHSTNGGQDHQLVEELYAKIALLYADRTHKSIEKDPIKLKSLLKSGQFVIASRFHALVSALSSGTPCIGTSWQHKYRLLFHEYNIEDYLLENPGDNIEQALETLIDKKKRGVLKSRLLVLSKEHSASLMSLLESHLLPYLKKKM